MENQLFELIPVDQELPGPDEHAIAFVPGQGFQSARYYNGSKTWQSTITHATINPTHWLRPKKQLSGKAFTSAEKMAMLELINDGPEIGRLTPEERHKMLGYVQIKTRQTGRMQLHSTVEDMDKKDTTKFFWMQLYDIVDCKDRVLPRHTLTGEARTYSQAIQLLDRLNKNGEFKPYKMIPIK